MNNVYTRTCSTSIQSYMIALKGIKLCLTLMHTQWVHFSIRQGFWFINTYVVIQELSGLGAKLGDKLSHSHSKLYPYSCGFKSKNIQRLSTHTHIYFQSTTGCFKNRSKRKNLMVLGLGISTKSFYSYFDTWLHQLGLQLKTTVNKIINGSLYSVC